MTAPKQLLKQLSELATSAREPTFDSVMEMVRQHPDLVMHRLPRSSHHKKARSLDGYTLLHLLASYGAGAEVREVIAMGAPLEARCNQGYTPLTLAIIDMRSHSSYEGSACQALIEAGARCDFVDDHGRDALQLRLLDMPTRLLQALLERGVPLDTRNKEGLPLLTSLIVKPREQGWFTSQTYLQENLCLLAQAWANVNPQVRRAEELPLAAALNTGNLEVADLLAHKGAHWQGRWDQGRTLMHAVANAKGLKWLLDKDPGLLEARDGRGRTPLLHLCERVNQESQGPLAEWCELGPAAIAFLIEQGADLHAPDAQGPVAVTPGEVLKKSKDPRLMALTRHWQARAVARQAAQEALGDLAP